MEPDEDVRRPTQTDAEDRRSTQAVETVLALGIGVAVAITVGAILGPLVPSYAGWIACGAGLIAVLWVLIPAMWSGL